MQKNNDDCDMHQSGEGAGEVVSDADGVDAHRLLGGLQRQRPGRRLGRTTSRSRRSTTARPSRSPRTSTSRVEPQEERSRGRCSDRHRSEHGHLQLDRRQQPAAARRHLGRRHRHQLDRPDGRRTRSRASCGRSASRARRVYEGVRTYSVRANSSRILDATGAKTDQLMVQTSLLRGNNQNNRKGGRTSPCSWASPPRPRRA